VDRAWRRSRQGSQRRFVLTRSRTSYRLLLETERGVKVWQLAALPGASDGRVKAVPLPDADAETRLLEQAARRGVEVGTYQVVDSARGGEINLYFSGRTVAGEWRFTRHGNDWTVESAIAGTNGGRSTGARRSVEQGRS
jgi:hypothetical protein